MKKTFAFNSVLLGMFCASVVQASTLDDIGFTDLTLELGAALPDGSNITVTQVEALASGACAPDMTLADFSHITFIDNTQSVCTGDSGHATGVAKFFYSSLISSTTAIGTVELFEVNNWLGGGFLNTGAPGSLANSIDLSSTRIANHSWGGTSGVNAEILRRTDFLIKEDEFIHVIGVHTNTVTNPLLSNAFNAIAAGISENPATTGTKAIDGTYVAGRAKPDIVSSVTSGSASAPRVASAAALLMDYAHTNTALSNGSTSNRGGIITIYNAERSESIKALLMAGADRLTVGNTNTGDITDYAITTSNGLDTRFGAGQVNIYNSYHMLAAGEQDSIEDGGSAFTNVGFDYNPSFGGLSGNATGTYSFTTSAIGGQKLKAALVWNLDVLTASSDNFYNMDLQLFDVTGGAEVVISNSTIDNTENLWLDLLSNRSYELRVIKGTGQLDFDWDYALAWQIVVPGVTVVETDSSTATAEDGSTDTFTLVLDSPPTDDVVIILTSSNINEATVLPASVTFTSANWSTLQTATVTGVNDLVDDGDINYNINFAVSSTSDTNYDGMTVASAAASNTDDDATFSFVDQSDVTLDTVITSNTVVITGLLGSTAISITGGEYKINSGVYTTVAGTINNNDTVTVRTTSSVNYNAAVDVVLAVGEVSDTFTATTLVDTVPDAFNFTGQTGVTLNTVTTSNTVTITDLGAATAISITGGEYKINSGAYTVVAGTINNNDTVTVRTTSSANYNTAVDVVLTVGGVSDTFTVTTLVDTVPDAFNFTDQTGVALNTVATSNAVTITGLGAATAISITGGEYKINSGAYTAAAGTINNNDTVTVRTTSSVSGLTVVNMELTIGNVSDTFTVTTEVDTDNDGIGNTLDTDDDGDTLSDTAEAILGTNPLLGDTDGDGDGDSIDNCPVDANADQLDTDSDGAGNVCDADDDNDGLIDTAEATLGTDPLLDDTDSDTVNDNIDNCPVDTNADQLDTDSDGAGNVCDADDDNDGLSDTTEATLGTDPLLVDTDGDSVSDNTDAFPTNIAASVDADNDGLPEEWNTSCDVTCQNNSGLTLDTTSSAGGGGGGGGSVNPLLISLLILFGVQRRRGFNFS